MAGEGQETGDNAVVPGGGRRVNRLLEEEEKVKGTGKAVFVCSRMRAPWTFTCSVSKHLFMLNVHFWALRM